MQNRSVTPTLLGAEQAIGHQQVDIQVQHYPQLADDHPAARAAQGPQHRPVEQPQPDAKIRRERLPKPDHPQRGNNRPGQDRDPDVLEPGREGEEKENHQAHSRERFAYDHQVQQVKSIAAEGRDSERSFDLV